MPFTFAPLEIPGKFGYGTMSLTWKANPPPLKVCLEALGHATRVRGIKFLNGGDFYGPDSANLKLLKAFLDENSDEFNRELYISIKGGLNAQTFAPAGDRSSLQASIDHILSFFPSEKSKRPKLLFELARVDPKTPYEESVAVVAEYVEKGLLDGVSLSEVGINLILRALTVCTPSCVELELSLMCQDITTNGILAELSKHNVAVVAYSPLCRGFLTESTANDPEAFRALIQPGDPRLMIDKFQGENFDHNVKLVQELSKYSTSKKGVLLEVLSLSWILAVLGRASFKGIKNVAKIMPIPSGSTPEKIDRNIDGLVDLSDKDLEDIDEICRAHPVQGYRYDKAHEALLNG